MAQSPPSLPHLFKATLIFYQEPSPVTHSTYFLKYSTIYSYQMYFVYAQGFNLCFDKACPRLLIQTLIKQNTASDGKRYTVRD